VPENPTPASLNSSAQLDAIVREYRSLGVRLEILLRAVLVVFLVLTVAIVPPVHDLAACWITAGLYTAWAGGLSVWSRRRRPGPLRLEGMILLVDLAALGVLTLLAGQSPQSWTADVLTNGFFLIPLLAATQLRPEVSAMVVAPTAAAFLATAVATQSANRAPTSSILLGTLVVVGVGCGCIGLSFIQRSRVAAIGRLALDRINLLGDLVTVEARERRQLSERLHDGALQYVLAARLDLEDARDRSDPQAFGRLERALTEASTLLRSTVSELHPAVLEHAGLAQALKDLATNSESVGGFAATIDVDGWGDDLRTPADALLYASARELLANVVKHAHARTVRINLARQGDVARLVIADDGTGIDEGMVERSVGLGHIGLASHRARLEASGGSLTLTPASPSGTIAEVDLPIGPASA
jgi:two-component system, NarL family, sensor kinase